GGAGDARHRVLAPHDANDMVTLGEAAAVRRFQHAAERFVAEDQPVATGRRPAVGAGDDLAVGSTHAERQRLDQQRLAVRRGFGSFVELHGSGRAGEDGNGLHDPSRTSSAIVRFRAGAVVVWRMTVKLYAMTCGRLVGRLKDMIEGEDGQVELPIPSYLIEHSKGRAVFDTGMHPQLRSDAAGRIGERAARIFGFEHFGAQDDVKSKLESIDRDPGKVDL